MEYNRNIEIHNGKAVVKNKECGLNDAEGRARILELFGVTARPKVDTPNTRNASVGKNAWGKAVNKAIAGKNALLRRIEEESKAQEAEYKRKQEEKKEEDEELRQKQGAQGKANKKERLQKKDTQKQKKKAKRKAQMGYNVWASVKKWIRRPQIHGGTGGSRSGTSSPYRGMMASSNWNTARSWWPYRN